MEPEVSFLALIITDFCSVGIKMIYVKNVGEKRQIIRKKQPPDWQWQPTVPSIAVAKFPTGLSVGVETVSQSDSARKLQPNYEDSIVTQHPREREREIVREDREGLGWREKIQSIYLCPGYWFHRGECRQWITRLLLHEDKHTWRHSVSPHVLTHG